MVKVSEEVLPTVGIHTGVIEGISLETRNYGGEDEEKYVVALRATDGEYPYTPMEKVYNATIAMQSGFGRFLQAVGLSLAPGADIDPQAAVGREVQFEVIEKDNGFLDIPAASIRQA